MKINLMRTFMTMVALGTSCVAVNSADAQSYGQPYAQPHSQNQSFQGPFPGQYQPQAAYGGSAARQPQQQQQAPAYQPQNAYGQNNGYQPQYGFQPSSAYQQPVAQQQQPANFQQPSPHQSAANLYQAPARWNQFRPVQERSLDDVDSLIENLPTPMGRQDSAGQGMELSMPKTMGNHGNQGNHGEQHQSGSTSRHSYGQSQGSMPQQHSHGSPQHSHGSMTRSAPAPSSTVYHSPHQAMDHGLVTESQSCQSSPFQSAMSAPHDHSLGGHSIGGHSIGAGGGSCGGPSCGPQPSFAPARAQLYPWFASANVLFLDLENSGGNRFFRNYDWTTRLADPESSVGFDTQIGRYLGSGQHGLAVRYFGWNPGEVTAIRDIPVAPIASRPEYREYLYDDGSGTPTAVDTFEAHLAPAQNVRVRRDLNFNSLEINLFSFGLMGAQRVAFAGCDNSHLARKHGGRYGFGGATGPLARSRSPRVRVTTSHGFRWFQAEDELELAFNINGAPDYQPDDLFDNFDVENNLYGYQFGSFLTYCLGSRLNLNFGGKVGIYGNDVEVRQRIGSRFETAYVAGDVNNRVDRTASDVVLASLGEVDLGLGYRVNNAWTIQGGYRLLGVTGVANAVDSTPRGSDNTRLIVDADNSYLIHGAYVGLGLNW